MKFAGADNFQQIFPTNNNFGVNKCGSRILGTIGGGPTISRLQRSENICWYNHCHIHCVNLITTIKYVVETEASSLSGKDNFSN